MATWHLQRNIKPKGINYDIQKEEKKKKKKKHQHRMIRYARMGKKIMLYSTAMPIQELQSKGQVISVFATGQSVRPEGRSST